MGRMKDCRVVKWQMVPKPFLARA